METRFPFAHVVNIELTGLPFMLMPCFQFPHKDKIFLLSFSFFYQPAKLCVARATTYFGSSF